MRHRKQKPKDRGKSKHINNNIKSEWIKQFTTKGSYFQTRFKIKTKTQYNDTVYRKYPLDSKVQIRWK